MIIGRELDLYEVMETIIDKTVTHDKNWEIKILPEKGMRIIVIFLMNYQNSELDSALQ